MQRPKAVVSILIFSADTLLQNVISYLMRALEITLNAETSFTKRHELSCGLKRPLVALSCWLSMQHLSPHTV